MAIKQYGDIKQIFGDKLESVDLIVGGSPCQDLSVAGYRAGLDGERSGLFMEMIRIIKEMRNKTNGEKPKFGLWENVPGAFSSNTGRDFSAVLGEFSRIIEPQAPDVPVPEEGWPDSGILLVGGGGSIAWRTHDAQFWGKTIRDRCTGNVLEMGTPQRRRRISLVADFRGQSAPEILFERKSMSGDSESGGTHREGFAGTTSKSTGETGKCLNSWDVQIKHIQPENGIADALYSGECRYSGGECYVLNDQGGARMIVTNGITNTLRSQMKHHEPIVMNPKQVSMVYGENTTPTFGTDDYKEPQIVLSYQDRLAVFDASVRHDCKQFDDVSETVLSRYGTGGNNQPLVVAIGNGQYVEDCKCQITDNTVRRLTPLECERLQGYPDGWTDIHGASDSKRYKALGNSIALPFWEHLAHRFAEIGKVKNIGSLFDGIGGFPLVFKRTGVETKWTSEIEPFCEQVVKFHIENGDL